ATTRPAKVWDWAADTAQAVVPQNVLMAVVLQADSILGRKREERLDARHDGVASHSADGLSEAYSGNEAPVLCRRAHQLVRRYQLVSGQLL
ncbi:MAG: hypothetical protein ACM359_07095, partial [Bacillota bacterium]